MASMASIGVDVAAGDSIPHLHCLIVADRSDMLAIGGPSNGSHKKYSAEMVSIGVDVAAIAGIPHLHVIIAVRSDALAVRRPGQRTYRIRRATIGIDVAAGG